MTAPRPRQRARRSDAGSQRDTYAGQPLHPETRRKMHSVWITNRNWEWVQTEAADQPEATISDVLNTLIDSAREQDSEPHQE